MIGLKMKNVVNFVGRIAMVFDNKIYQQLEKMAREKKKKLLMSIYY